MKSSRKGQRSSRKQPIPVFLMAGIACIGIAVMGLFYMEQSGMITGSVLGITTRIAPINIRTRITAPTPTRAMTTISNEGEGCGGGSRKTCRTDLDCVPVCTGTTSPGDGIAQFTGVCAKKNLFFITTTPTPTISPSKPTGKTDATCKRTGCSGQLCVDATAPTIATTCEWRAAYDCYRAADCVKQTNGVCGFTQNTELQTCLTNAQ